MLRPRRAGSHNGAQGRAPRRAMQMLGDAFLWLAAIAGFVCIALVLAAQVFNISLIMFKTGSMAPTIPAGSVALVREVPASMIAVGDIVTVDRPGDLPVTHRVISVEPTAQGAWKIEMKGDANEQPDPVPYKTSTVRQTLGHVPRLAPLIVAMGSPWVLGCLTLGAAGLVTWAFWPRTSGRGGQD